MPRSLYGVGNFLAGRIQLGTASPSLPRLCQQVLDVATSNSFSLHGAVSHPAELSTMGMSGEQPPLWGELCSVLAPSEHIYLSLGDGWASVPSAGDASSHNITTAGG